MQLIYFLLNPFFKYDCSEDHFFNDFFDSVRDIKEIIHTQLFEKIICDTSHSINALASFL